jgi:hypothetical protein
MKKQLDKHVLKTPNIYMQIQKIYKRKYYLSAYLKVFIVCSHEPELGEIQEIITV